MDNPDYRNAGDVAIATIRNPPVNALSHAVRRGLLDAIERAFADDAVRALILIGDGSTFVAGADIQDFGKPYASPSLYDILDALMAAPKPVIAALHGAAFGGGLELALACQWRIATPAAQVAQPEIKLGLMPGGGGTQWWTRLAGPAIALEVCLSGAPMAAHAAHACGVIDRISDQPDGDDLLPAALTFAQEILDGRIASRQLMQATDKLVASADFFTKFRSTHAAAWQGLLAPWKIVDCIEAACRLSFAEGYQLERAAFRECEQSAQSRALIHLFFAERAAAKRPAGDAPAPARPLTHVGVVGDSARAHRLVAVLRAAKLGVTPVAAVCSAQAPGWPAGCELVIDASDAPAAELGLRARTLLAGASDDAVFVVDAPDIDVAAVGAASGHPAAVLGIDSDGPRLLGVRMATASGAVGLGRVMRLTRQLRRIALASPATAMAPAAALRKALVDARSQLVALGVPLARQARVLADFGFENEAVAALAPPLQNDDLPMPAGVMSDHEVLQQLLYALVNAGARLLADGGVWRPGDLDLAAVHALGFPAHRGGPMWWAQMQGFVTIEATIGRYRARAGAPWLASVQLHKAMNGMQWRARPAAP